MRGEGCAEKRAQRPRCPLACLARRPRRQPREDYLQPVQGRRRQTATPSSSPRAGVDLEHAGYDTSKPYAQPIQVALLPSQAKRLEDKGVELEKLASPKAGPRRCELADGGDSPNPFYTVYRQYMEPGGILDEMESSRPTTATS